MNLALRLWRKYGAGAMAAIIILTLWLAMRPSAGRARIQLESLGCEIDAPLSPSASRAAEALRAHLGASDPGGTIIL